MINNACVVVLLLVVFAACTKPQHKIHFNLSDKELVALMYDVQFSDVAVSGLSAERRDSLKTILWGKLTTIYGMSESEIKMEIKNLESDPVKMKMVFDRIKIMSDSIR